MTATVAAVHISQKHTFSKFSQDQITLLAGLGVEGDAHMGVTVKHRSRVKADPAQPNLRQVHLVHSELFAEVAEKGFSVEPGDIGENITTAGIDLLALPRDTVLKIGDSAAVQITGLRNPCLQLDNFQTGLMAATLDKDEDGNLIRKAGIMGIVLTGGPVKVSDEIVVELPPEPHHKLERV
ncbi:MAG: MOSC domain-containing protein [Chloroflexota bacterium]